MRQFEYNSKVRLSFRFYWHREHQLFVLAVCKFWFSLVFCVRQMKLNKELWKDGNLGRSKMFQEPFQIAFITLEKVLLKI